MPDSSPSLLDQTVTSLLNELGARSPTPGGGVAAALAGALGAAMGRMVGAYSMGKPSAPPDPAIQALCAQLDRADHMFRRLVDEDAHAYHELSAAARAARNEPGKESAHQSALAVATAVPFEIAAVACRTLRALAALRPLAKPALLSDLGVAAVLAESCARIAAFSARVNLAAMPEKQRAEPAEELQQLLDHAGRSCTEILDSLPTSLKPDDSA
jgi:formiminotetrahydrofolate cyclodeaminase